MRVFFDSNIWVSAFATSGLCADLVRLLLRRHDRGSIELLAGEPVVQETLRVLVDKFHAGEDDLTPVRVVLVSATQVAHSNKPPPLNIPDPDDIPIIACALEASADIFVTGDKALLDLKTIGNMAILSPRDFWVRVRGI